MVNVTDVYRLSPTQEGMLYDSLSASDSGMYLIQMIYELRGSVDVVALREAFEQAVQRHPVLRTSFHWEELDHPVQVVHEHAQLPFKFLDWYDLPQSRQQDSFDQLIETERRNGLDFGKPPLVSLTLIRRSDDAHALVWSFHHILMEGWSASIVLQEVLTAYRAIARGQTCSFVSPPRYRDYIQWLLNQDMDRVKSYWHESLRGFSAPTPLGIGRGANTIHAPVIDYESEALTLPPKLSSALESTARTHHLTLNTLFQGAWSILLSRYSGHTDIMFGSVVSGRAIPLADADKMVGLFINILPTRVNVKDDAPTLDWLRELQRRQVEMREFEFSSLADIKNWSEMEPGLPLFESLVVFENWAGTMGVENWNEGLTLTGVTSRQGGPGYPVSLVVNPSSPISMSITYDLTRFEPQTIRQMLKHLQVLLEGFTCQANQSVSKCSLLTSDERRRLLGEWNGSAHDDPSFQPVHVLVEAATERTPDNIALIFEDRNLTYYELNERANQLAHYLRSLGVGPEVLVGISMDRSVDLIVGLLGILKAGGAYLPIDPDYPRDRIEYLLGDSSARIVLTHNTANLASTLANCNQNPQLVFLDTEWTQIAQSVGENGKLNPANQSSGEHLAYVIYTSGSTGRPKGVMIEHRSLASYIQTAAEAYSISPKDRILQFASINFDASAEEIYPALIQGAVLALRNDRMIASTSEFLARCHEWQITVLNLPTSYWHELVTDFDATGIDFCRSVRLVIIGGEKALPDRLARWQRRVSRSVTLMNTYGPTETTIVATMCKLNEVDPAKLGRELPIGKPVRNVHTYILDRNKNPIPAGIPGELYIGGVQVARGYLNNSELTSERFVPNPHNPGSRLYRTGDRVRYSSDGNIEFLDRIDNQIKVRGYRIEPGEIESVLRENSSVKDAVVVMREDTPNQSRLVAYFVCGDEAEITPGEARRFLQDRLPNYMIPELFMQLDVLPKNSSGKIERSALPEPNLASPENSSTYMPPDTAIEKVIADTWSDILSVNRSIGISDNFFELGGNSIKAIRLVTRIRDKFKFEFPVRRVFECPTVRELSQALIEEDPESGGPQRIAELIIQVQQMSDEEVVDRLNGNDQVPLTSNARDPDRSSERTQA